MARGPRTGWVEREAVGSDFEACGVCDVAGGLDPADRKDMRVGAAVVFVGDGSEEGVGALADGVVGGVTQLAFLPSLDANDRLLCESTGRGAAVGD